MPGVCPPSSRQQPDSLPRPTRPPRRSAVCSSSAELPCVLRPRIAPVTRWTRGLGRHVVMAEHHQRRPCDTGCSRPVVPAQLHPARGRKIPRSPSRCTHRMRRPVTDPVRATPSADHPPVNNVSGSAPKTSTSISHRLRRNCSTMHCSSLSYHRRHGAWARKPSTWHTQVQRDSSSTRNNEELRAVLVAMLTELIESNDRSSRQVHLGASPQAGSPRAAPLQRLASETPQICRPIPLSAFSMSFASASRPIAHSLAAKQGHVGKFST